jgi:tetratricopeptide (TPR) repeat protein
MTRPVTNRALETLLTEAAYHRSLAAFARQVNRAAADRFGLVLRYDGASVYWWLRGRCPEQPAPELIAELLSARLGRAVQPGDLGFAALAADADAQALQFPTSVPAAIETAAGLWRRLGAASSSSSSLVLPYSSAPFVASAAEQAGWRWHFDAPDVSVARTAGRPVDAMDVQMLRSCAEQFLELDRRHGGGHARAFLGDFLTRDVALLLRGRYGDAVGRELFAAAAELTGMAAFMSYDIGDHGAAQRAFIQALRLSKAAGDRLHGAHILANLATQAIFLGLPGEAVRLARAAVEGAGRRPCAMVAARLHATAANAHALAGDRYGFAKAIARAQRALERADAIGPDWARYFSPAHLAGAAMRSLLDLGRPGEALGYQQQALDLGPANMRTRALHTALTATAHARAGHIDQAALLAVQALQLARRIRSRRVTARITLLANVLLPHRPVAEVSVFLDQLPDRLTSEEIGQVAGGQAVPG